MAKSFLIKPSDIELRLQKRYKLNQKKWLAGDGVWPLELPLGVPTQTQAQECIVDVQQWQKLWREWAGAGRVFWCERHWAQLGRQRLPERIVFENPNQVVGVIQLQQSWHSITQRYLLIVSRWPRLTKRVLNYIKILSDYSDSDFNLLIAVLEWFEQNPDSGLFIRQLPIIGIHTKWLDSRKTLVAELLKTLRGNDEKVDFYQLTGIRREPETIRFRILDKKLCDELAGLDDITTTIDALNRMQLPLRSVYIVENIQTGLAFNDIPGAIVFMGLGYAVELYSKISWLHQIPIFYWGDIDTHGFVILDKLRHYFPNAVSILMDEQTFLVNKTLWVTEKIPATNTNLALLTKDENSVYQKLYHNKWGDQLRLEQERIPWELAWKKVINLNSG